MRLWSFHPRYLDVRGLLAVWREGLLAQKVLAGHTRGYVHHPQLDRFRADADPAGAIAAYLKGIHAEAVARGYSFAEEKILSPGNVPLIPLGRGQLDFEWEHFLRKIYHRDRRWFYRLEGLGDIEPHPLFIIVPGAKAEWERG